MLNQAELGSSRCIIVLDISSDLSADVLGWRAGIPAGDKELSE